jgi:CelD/BcsL family acetyltransferase involved in cellulose biosynthesis
LSVQNQPVAIRLGYLYRGVYHGLQSGYDPEEPNAGRLLLHWVLEDLIEEGAHGYDFLTGVADYKLSVGGDVRDALAILGGSRNAKNLLLLKLGFWPTGRFISQGPPECLGCGHD